MKSNELLPFSRNRYYKGKMLTSTDFEAEQLYMNSKRCFNNQTIVGSGIACGLNVISLDDLSFMIESGVAIDGIGREIVVDSSVVKKLSAITGFENLESNQVSLCLRYKESEVQPVYAISRQESSSDFEYNRIEDGYELFLVDDAVLDEEFEMETEFYTGGVLFENHDYQVRVKLPANICAGYYVKLEIEVQKISEENVDFNYSTIFQTPAMTTLDGSQELFIQLDGINLEKDKKLVREYWMLAQKETYEDTSIMVKAGSTKALVNGIECPSNAGVSYKINILDISPELLAARETNRVSLELRTLGSGDGAIRLADITLVRTESAYLIERVDDSVRKYIPTPGNEWKRLEYSRCFYPKYPFLSEKKEEHDLFTYAEARNQMLRETPRIASGIVEIPIGDNAKKGNICYSDEIMHGLGTGNVYVEVGYEYLEENELLGRNAKTTVFGDPDLFNENTKVAAESAVKVYNDKGSFVVALKLNMDINMIILTYRWVAIRYDTEKLPEEMEPDHAQSISVVTPTVILGTKQNYFFQVEYNNMKPCSITYRLMEAGSGEISSDGIYTAPSKEGVYEICIYCTDKPQIHTYAYAIVKRKASEEQSDS